MARRKTILIAKFLLMVLSSGSICLGKYSGGTGEPNDPYLIETAEDLNDIGNHPEDFNKCFLMVADINLADYTGTQFNIIGEANTPFTGVFDGNDHKIWNFTWSSTDSLGIGLFGHLVHTGHIKDLGMENVDINATNGEFVGGLAGYNGFGTISNCYATGSVSGDVCTGGLVGLNQYGMISNCHAAGSVSGDVCTGGLVGLNQYGMISNCHAAGTVDGNDWTGGLVGLNPYGTISNCHAAGTVDGNDWTGGLVGADQYGTISNCHAAGAVDGNRYTGGLVGGANQYCTISNCYATGSVDGNRHTGGLVGFNGAGTISNCYANGTVNGETNTGGLVGGSYLSEIWNCYSRGDVNGQAATGGLVGYNYKGTISNSYSKGNASGNYHIGGLVGGFETGTISKCYAIGSVDGNDYTGGLVGYRYHTDGTCTASFWDIETGGPDNGIGTPLTTKEMQTESTFTDAGWDFIEIWNIGENQTYPFLRTHLPSDINKDNETNLYDLAILADHWLEGTTP